MHARRGELAQAREIYSQLVASNPEHVDARVGLGSVLVAAGQPGPAQEPLTVMPQFVNGALIGFRIYDADRVILFDAGRSMSYVAVYVLQGREVLPTSRLFESLDRYREETEMALKYLPRRSVPPVPPGP